MKMKTLSTLLFFVITLPISANLRTSRLYTYVSYSFALGNSRAKIFSAGIQFARTTQDELSDNNGNRQFGSARIGIEYGLISTMKQTMYLRIPYGFFNYGYRNKTGRQQTFNLSVGPGYVFSKTEQCFFLSMETSIETSSLLAPRLMRRIGLRYFWTFAPNQIIDQTTGKNTLSLAGYLDRIFINVEIALRIGDFGETTTGSDKFNIGFFD